MTPAPRPRPLLAALARARAAALALAVLAPATVALPGCFLFAKDTTASRIEQGEAVTTGKEPYDAFFAAVRAAREESRKAEAQAAEARVSLSRSLGLQDTATASAALEAARARATKLLEGGVRLHLQITPEVKLISGVGRRTRLEDADKPVLTALEESAQGSLAISKKLSETASRTAELEKQRSALAGEADKAFADAPEGKRRDIMRELEAAARVIADASKTNGDQAARASKFVLDLAMAIETGGADGKRAPGGPAARPQGGGRSGAGTSAGASTSRPATPPSKPAPKPAGGGDDFEP